MSLLLELLESVADTMTYRRAVLKMQQDLLEQGWDSVTLKVSKVNSDNLTLVVKQEGSNSITLTALNALPSFSVLWASKHHNATGGS